MLHTKIFLTLSNQHFLIYYLQSLNQMGKKMKFPFLFKSTPRAAEGGAWPWPTCANNPKTLSFRQTTNNTIYKTMNSAYNLHDKNSKTESFSTQDSFFSITHEKEIITHDEESDVVLQGLRSERLFFEPGDSNSILEVAKTPDFPYKEDTEILAMDSKNPFDDFRVSMMEMVKAHDLKDWDCLEELLSCYLRVNLKSNHGFIVAAFVDLLLHLSVDNNSSVVNSTIGSSDNTNCCSFTSPLSFSCSNFSGSSTSPCLSSLENEDKSCVEVCSSSSGV